jgi:hypothetical protein
MGSKLGCATTHVRRSDGALPRPPGPLLSEWFPPTAAHVFPVPGRGRTLPAIRLVSHQHLMSQRWSWFDFENCRRQVDRSDRFMLKIVDFDRRHGSTSPSFVSGFWWSLLW